MPLRGPIPLALRPRLERVRLFLCDVDGVLTDCAVYMNGRRELKRFDVQDGLGLRLLQRCGIRVGWISGRPSPATTQRAADLKVDYLHQSAGSKVQAIERILSKAGLGWGQVCFVGDDLLDLGAMKRAGLAVAVPAAIPEAKALAHLVTRAPGGAGAVREVVDLILRAQGHWDALVKEYAA